MAFAKFQGNQFRIDEEITENHAILVNLTASIIGLWIVSVYKISYFLIISGTFKNHEHFV